MPCQQALGHLSLCVHPPRGGCSTPAHSALVLFVQGRWLTPSTLTQALSTTRCLAYLEVSCSVSLLSMLQWYSCHVLCVIILRAGSEANLVVDLPPCPLHRCFVQCMLLHQGAVTPRSTVIHQWFINALAPIEGDHASASCTYINAAVQVTWPQTSSCAAVHNRSCATLLSAPSPCCLLHQAAIARQQAHLRLVLSQHPVLDVHAVVVMLLCLIQVACHEQHPCRRWQPPQRVYGQGSCPGRTPPAATGQLSLGTREHMQAYLETWTSKVLSQHLVFKLCKALERQESQP